MIAPKPAPPTVPTTAPFSLVVSGSEQPKKTTAKTIAEVFVIFFTTFSFGSTTQRYSPRNSAQLLPRADFDSLRVQLLDHREHRLGEMLFCVCPATLLQTVL
jgi:hypothetical protein